MDSSQNRFCKCCSKNFSVLCWEQHVRGKKHLKMESVYKYHDKRASLSIFVFGFKPGTSEHQLANYFGQFGPVAKVIFGTGNYAIIEYVEKEAVERTLTRSAHFIGCQRLTVKRKRVNTPTIKPKDSHELSAESSVMDIHLAHLKKSANVEEQMNVLFKRVVVNEKDTEDRLEICRSIEELMQPFFPKCKVVPFGSSVNGLGVTGCDLDMYLDLDPCRNDRRFQDIKASVVSFNQIKKNLDYARESGDLHFLKSLQLLEDRKIVVVIGKVLISYAKECRRVLVIPQARCPLVNFFHAKFEINCDMQTRNRLGVHNSVLLRVLQQLDHRVRPLLFTIRLWAKQHHLCDSKQGRFSSYAVAMMTVFYLQNCKPPVLPSVETLHQLAEATTTFNGWTTSFCMDPDKVSKSENPDDLESLLRGFFQFHAKLDHSSHVLSILTGKCIKKSDFLLEMDKNEKIAPFRTSRINVQDPLELDRNITGGVGDVGLIMWLEALDRARELIDSTRWTDRWSQPVWGMAALLTNEVSLADGLRVAQSRAKKMLRDLKSQVVGDDGTNEEIQGGTEVINRADGEEVAPCLEASIVTTTSDVNVDSLKPLAIPLDVSPPSTILREELLHFVSEIIKDVLQIGLKFKCTETDSEHINLTAGGKTSRSSLDSTESSPTKYFKQLDGTRSPSQASSEPSNEVMNRRRFFFEGSSAVYKQRKSARCQVPLQCAMADTLTLESGASKVLLAQNLVGQVTFKFVCDVCRVDNTNSKFLLHLRNLIPNQREFDGPFYQFLQSFVPKLVRQVILERYRVESR